MPDKRPPIIGFRLDEPRLLILQSLREGNESDGQVAKRLVSMLLDCIDQNSAYTPADQILLRMATIYDQQPGGAIIPGRPDLEKLLPSNRTRVNPEAANGLTQSNEVVNPELHQGLTQSNEVVNPELHQGLTQSEEVVNTELHLVNPITTRGLTNSASAVNHELPAGLTSDSASIAHGLTSNVVVVNPEETPMLTRVNQGGEGTEGKSPLQLILH